MPTRITRLLSALTLMLGAALAGAGTVTGLRGFDVIAAIQPASAVPEPTARPVRGAVLAAGDRLTTTSLATGDRLKIAFYETIDVTGGHPAGHGAHSVLHTFYQRADLSGDHTIDHDGVVSVPRLGRFQVTGLRPRDLEAELTARSHARPDAMRTSTSLSRSAGPSMSSVRCGTLAHTRLPGP